MKTEEWLGFSCPHSSVETQVMNRLPVAEHTHPSCQGWAAPLGWRESAPTPAKPDDFSFLTFMSPLSSQPTRMPYQGACRRVEFQSSLLAIPAFTLFGLGIYLENFRGFAYATPIAGILSVITFGLLDVLCQRRLLSRLPCPKCGRVPLRPTEDARRMQLLLCDSCGIEWDTQINNDAGESY
ncbi:MAG: hypothetical protein RIS79_1204 [Verrucomicrobiota bacterium]|jgi:predicted RNA-binding Zn-ribbon protein involved in translation (DUF1610 family)